MLLKVLHAMVYFTFTIVVTMGQKKKFIEI